MREPFTRTERLLMEALPATLTAQVGFPRQAEIIRPEAADRMLEFWGGDFRHVCLEEALDEDCQDDVPPRNRLYDVFWNMSERDKELACRVALGACGVSVEARSPEDRSGLPERLGSVVSKVREQFSPACCTRVGLRYACEVGMWSASHMIRPEFIGLPRLERHASGFMALDERAMSSKAVFRMDDGLVVRGTWGQPSADVHGGGRRSDSSAAGNWMLDLNLSLRSVKPFEAGELREAAEGMVGCIGKLVGCMATDTFREELELQDTLVGPDYDFPDGGSGDFLERMKKELTARKAAIQIRWLARLSKEEAAELFGVSRQTVHNWENCRPVTKKNQVLVYKVLLAVRHLYQGSASVTRSLLMKAGEPGGKSRFDLIKERRFDEAVAGVENKDNLPPFKPLTDKTMIHIPIDVQMGGSISDSTRFPAKVRPLKDRGPAWHRKHGKKSGDE